MLIEPFENVARIRNNLDADHCTQFALLAALETLGDSSLNEETVDVATGYTPGGTWPYTMLNWLAENGYEVRHFEDTDFNLFQTSPRSEFERQGLDAATIDYFFEISDFPREQAQLSDALANPAIVLENRKPEISDIVSGLQDGWLPIVSLDATTLLGNRHEEFDGHVVLVTAASVDRLRLQDPGPPAHWDWDVTNEVVLDALRTPSDSSGTVTLIRRAPIMAAGGDVDV